MFLFVPNSRIKNPPHFQNFTKLSLELFLEGEKEKTCEKREREGFGNKISLIFKIGESFIWLLQK